MTIYSKTGDRIVANGLYLLRTQITNKHNAEK